MRERRLTVRFNVPVELEDCFCAEYGRDGTKRHTPGPRTLFADNQGKPSVAACPNHTGNYASSSYFKRILTVTPNSQPLLCTVYVRSSTGKLRTLVVRRAVSGQPVWYVQSDSGKEYMVQFRRKIWLCECKHFLGRAFARHQTCHHIEGVREADPSALYIEQGE